MPRYRQTQAVIFDMDGLLIDSEPLWHQSEHDVLNEIGADTSKVSAEESLGLRIDQVVQMHYDRAPWQGASIQQVIDKIIEQVTIKIIAQQPLLPGVKETLALAKELNFKIGLASASPLKLINTVVELFNIGDYFDILNSAEALPYSKPHPEIYLLTAKALQVKPQHCVTFEDSFNGMIATKAAQMRSIVVPEPALIDDPRWALADVKLNTLKALRKEDLF